MYLDLCMLADVVFHRVRVVFGAAKTVNGLHSRIREELIEDVGSKGTGIVTLWCTLGGYMELLNLSTNRMFGLSDYEIQVELELNSGHHCIRCSHRTSRIYGVDSNSVQPLRGQSLRIFRTRHLRYIINGSLPNKDQDTGYGKMCHLWACPTTRFALRPYNPAGRKRHGALCLTVLTYQKLTNGMVQWQTMKEHGFVPEQAKGVEHEARNGVLLCALHHLLFDTFCYYIRWVPEVVF